VIRITDAAEGDFLLVYGLPDNKEGVHRVRAVEAASGLAVKIIMTSGCWHHLFLDQWLTAFPDPVKFLFPKAKFTETRNGKLLLANEAKSKRISLFDTEADMPCMDKYADQVKFVVFDQQTTYPDEGPTAATSDLVPHDKMGEVMAYIGETQQTARFAAVTLYHVATKTASIDHNFDMFQPGEAGDTLVSIYIIVGVGVGVVA
jgi:hypothetical protein